MRGKRRNWKRVSESRQNDKVKHPEDKEEEDPKDSKAKAETKGAISSKPQNIDQPS